MAKGAIFPNRPTGPLVARAQMTLGMTHRELGEALGVSERTAQRWAGRGGSHSVEQLCELARRVFPRDAELASTLAEAASESLVSLGLVSPPAPAPPGPTPLAPHLVADLVVCAAANALGVVPSAARAGLVAAFARASELGLTVADVEKVLAPAREGPAG